MPPKGKAKKGKKQDNDDIWANAGESVNGSVANDTSVASTSASTAVEVASAPAVPDVSKDDDGDNDGDDFMAMLQKRKDRKKPKKGKVDFEDGPPPGEGSDTEAAAAKGDISAPKAPQQMTAEELADEEFGPVKDKKKKKKGKAAKTGDDDDEEGQETREPNADGEDGDEGGPKILSKKEKEKLKKEKERAKKKAQAAAKKAEQGATAADPDNPPPAATAESAVAPGADDDDDAGEAEGSAAKKKKKKKKAKKDDEDEEDRPTPAPAATASGKKKGGMAISALREMMEARRKAEEAERQRIEEERRRIEEEERRIQEEAERKEAERLRRKEKEKAKKELAKKEGRFLTPKQKAERDAAERRRQAMIASGMVVQGLQTDAAPAKEIQPKKVVYGKKPAKGKQPVATSATSQAASSTPTTPHAPSPATLPPESVKSPSPEPKEKAWDESSEGEKPSADKEEGVKSDWDDESDEDPKMVAKPTPQVSASTSAPGPSAPKAALAPTTAKPVTPKATNAASKPTSKPSTTPSTKSAANAAKPGKASVKEETESEEESEEEDSEEESSEEDSDEESEDSDGLTKTQRMAQERKEAAAARRKQREEEARAAASKDNLRSPICCILGHVDTGKTKLLDKIRQTNVQEGEAGGITQQIGATYFPVEAIKTKTAVVNKDGKFEYKIPGLLIIDTPGHESFTNLRSRGSSLCNIAILVVDIMHGLEPQTIESIGLLKQGKTPFIIALNKIDRLYGWQATPDNGVQDSLAKQKPAVQREFEDRSSKIKLAIAEQGLNSEIYWKNDDPRRTVNIVPTSAITGEGVPDMIKLLVDLTQTRMVNSLMYISTLECTVLEVKVVEGLGTTVDVILSNGYLRESDKIVVCGLNGPIVTQVRALLTPQPLRELRIKSAYVHHKEVKAANGIKVVAPDLDKAIAGSKLLVIGPDDDEEELMEEVMKPLEDLLKRISTTQQGVHVQASTLGSLEALLSFLEDSKIPVSGINIGPVHKKDVRRAMTQLEKAQEMACILCFDVPVDKEAEKLAEEVGIKLFRADIIYHLFDAFTAYHKEITEAKRKDAAPQAVWPCRLKIIAVFAKRDPIIVGVDIIEGTLRVGTPLCVINKEKQIVKLGKITSLEINHKAMDIVKKSQAGGGVAVKIEHAVYETAKMVGRHFDENDELMSMISRQSIDVLKETFRNDVSKEEWLLIKNLKGRLGIP